MGCDCLMGVGFSIGVMNCFAGRWRSWLYSIWNVVNVTELYIWEWLILCDVNFITIKKNYSNETAGILVICTIDERQTHSTSCSLLGLGLFSWSSFRWLTFSFAFSQQCILSGFTRDIGVKGLKPARHGGAGGHIFSLFSSFVMAGQLVKVSGEAELALEESLGDNAWMQRHQGCGWSFL